MTVFIYQVAIHEIGHTLGLPHLNLNGSVMRPEYSPLPSKYIPEFGRADREVMRILYGKNFFLTIKQQMILRLTFHVGLIFEVSIAYSRCRCEAESPGVVGHVTFWQ